jgi:hypothetical protein
MTTVLRQAGGLVLATFTVTIVVAQSAGQQPAASSSTGLIVGRTIDGAGQAIGGAVVSLNNGQAAGAAGSPSALPASLSRFPARVISDSAGHFVFHDLPKGPYALTASKPGYADAAFGRRAPTDTGGQSLILGDDERREVTLAFWKVATIGGTVVDEAGEPVIGIQVRVFKRATVGGRPQFTQFGTMPSTDDRGVYRISSLLPGDYVVGIVTTQTTVPTSLQEAYAAADKSGTGVQDLQRELDRSRGVLGGMGLMASGQRVGSWLLQTPLGFGNQRDVMAPPIDGGKVFAYPTVFYPAAMALSKATIVSLGSGEERSDLDLQLRPAITARVSGSLTGPNGPERHTTIDLMPAGAEDVQRDYDFAAASTVTDTTGAFTFLGVPSGVYTIRVLKMPLRPATPSAITSVIQTGTSTISSGGGSTAPPPIPSEPTWWANVAVSVEDSDVTDVAVTLRAGARVTGHLEFDGAAQKPAADRLAQAGVQVQRADGRTTFSNQFTLVRGVVDATGAFNTYQFPPGRYVVRATGSWPGWTFKGAFLNGRDVSDVPLDLGGDDVADVIVTFTDRPTELAGTARDSKGPDAMATVLVFPAQPELWVDHGATPRRFRAVRASTDGTYRIDSLPVGDYLVVAVHSGVPADWLDATFLQRASSLATRIAIADGEKKTYDVQTKEVR